MRISDWSSDVCSSDLAGPTKMRSTPPDRRHRGGASWLVSLVGREVAQQVGGPIEPLGPEPGLGEALRSGLHEHAVYERLIRSEEHTSELQSLMRISYAVFCLNKKISTQSLFTITP